MSESNTAKNRPTSYGITPPERVAGTEFINENGKNSKLIICKFCGSKMLDPNSATLETVSLSLHSNKNGGAIEELTEFWKVMDKFDYVNMGFSRSVDPVAGARGYKYLTCADCEIPVVGLQWLDEEPSYLSTQRVNFQE